MTTPPSQPARRRGRPLSENWIPASQMATAIGVGIHQLSVLRLEMDPGYHYRLVSKRNALKPSYRYHRARVDQWLDERTKNSCQANLLDSK